METVDRWLARDGYYVLFGAFFAGMVLSGDGEHRSLWSGIFNLAGAAAGPFLWRATVLRGGPFARLRPPAKVRHAVRAFVLDHRLPAALVYGALSGWFAQWHYDRAWFSVLHGVLSGVAAWYATSPLPEQERAATA